MAVFLRDPADTSGALLRYEDESAAEEAIGEFGYERATPDEVEARALERARGDQGGRAFLEAAAAGAVDAAVAPVRLVGTLGAALSGDENLDPGGEVLSGRKFIENVVAVASELGGDGVTAEAAARRYAQEAREIAEANPWASTTGYIGGQVAGGLGLAGAASSLGKAAASAAASTTLGRTAARQGVLSMATEGAVEGTILATGEAGEQAYIQNERLTGEQILGAIGLGSLLGGTAGAGLYGAGAVYRGGKRAAGAAADRLRTVFDPKPSASADTVAEVAGQALGVKVSRADGGRIKDALEWMREKGESAQAAATGADLDTIQKYGGMRWDREAIAGRDAYINREAIREGAKKDFNAALQDLSNATEPVIDEVRFTGLKREHVAEAIDKEQTVAQLAEARTQADRIEQMVVPMRKPGATARARQAAGAAEPLDREAYVQTFAPEVRGQIDDELDDEIREALDALGKKTDEGTRSWKRVEQDILRDRVERQMRGASPEALPGEGTMRAGNAGVLAEVDQFVTRHLSEIRKTQDPVEAYMALDGLKRGLQKYADRTGKSAQRLLATSPERAAGSRQLSDYIQRFQEPLRQSLENEAVWGKAGANQRAINAALTRYIESNRVFQGRFMRETVGYRGLGIERTVREDATSAFMNRLGLAENQASEQHLRAHLKATTDVLRALDGAIDIGEKKALVQGAIETERKLNMVLDGLDKNVRVANQIDELIRADAGGERAAAKTLVGAFLGGPIGAAAGFAADVASSPGKMMRQAIGIQRVMRRNNVDIEAAMDRVFARGKQEARAAAPSPSPSPPGAAAPANDVAGEEVFKDEVSTVRRRIDGASVAGAGLVAGSLATDEDDELAAGALAVPLLGKGALRKAARGVIGQVTPLGATVPVALRAFLGEHQDKQAAFRERAREIHAATAEMGEGIRQAVTRDLGDIPADFPRLASSITAGLTRGALFLESKLPSSYRASPGAIGRSASPVADHDIAKFARYWSAVNSPVSVLHDMALGIVTDEQVEAIRTVYPELYVKLSEQLLERAADADARGERLPMQTRMQIGRFVGVQMEPAFRPSVLELIDGARQGLEQSTQQPTPRPQSPPNLAGSVGPESVQIEQRTARVG